MHLLRHAVTRLAMELRDGGMRGKGDDVDERAYRVRRALRALAPEFDDVNLRRFRAIRFAEHAATLAQVPPSDQEIEAEQARLAHLRVPPFGDVEQFRQHMKVSQPVQAGVHAQFFLSQIDSRFQDLDPMVIYEEFSEAEPTTGGKTDGGDGRIGPVRALARLALMCGALDYKQEDGEDFDAAVSRVRSNLLVTRSRIRKEMQPTPGWPPYDGSGAG
jgi:hypothetical protein